MAMSNNSAVISFSIAILLLLTLLLLVSYNSRCKMDNVERFETPQGTYGVLGGSDNYFPAHRESVATNANRTANVNSASDGVGSFNASEPSGDESYSSVSANGISGAPVEGQTCFARDRLTSDDLLPKDAANSKWAQVNPSGSGDVRDQNYLTAGYHIGVNTVGQSLRNANLQLRSEIPNPQTAVSPWMISTIEPDVRPVSFEIGSAPSY